jgi:hypothetical protein
MLVTEKLAFGSYLAGVEKALLGGDFVNVQKKKQL